MGFNKEVAELELAEAIRLWNEGDFDWALKRLGQGLHPLQDIDAHMNWGDNQLSVLIRHVDCTGCWVSFDDPNIDFDPASVTNRTYVPHAGTTRYQNTVSRTKQYLQRFVDATGLRTPMP